MLKKVSVIIPVYGVEKYIKNTIQSVLNQTYKNIEILIVDDGFPDLSIEICQQFTDSRIQIVRQKNRGLAGARNTGIRLAKGEYISFLDGDDIWLPEKLEKNVAHLENSPSVGISFNRSALIDEFGNYLGIYQMPKLREITLFTILCRNPISNGSNAVIRREVLEAIKYQDNFYGGLEDFYFDEQLREAEDIEFWLRIAIQTHWLIEGIPEALTLYRVNPRGLSANILNHSESWEKVIEKTRSYAPKEFAQWEHLARAYYLRYAARRAVSLKERSMAVKLVHRSLATHSGILLQEPRRTLLTLAAAYSLWLLPQPLYRQIETLALNMTGASHRRRILQDQFKRSLSASVSPF